VEDIPEEGDDCLDRGGVVREADDVLFKW